MKRAFLIIIFAIGMAGCKSQTPTVDPFFGRTTVPPPPTGSIAGRAGDPYYQSSPSMQPGYLQANAPYNQGRPTSNAPLFSGNSVTNPSTGSTWTNPFNTSNSPPASTLTNQYSAPPYSSPAQSAMTGPAPTGAAGTAGTSPYAPQSVPQNNLNPGMPPAGYPPQTVPAQPASMPSTTPGSTLPGGNRYTPPGGFNYQGTSNQTPNSQTAPPSPNRVATPFFAGGTPNRRQTIPVTDASSQPLNNAQATAGVINPPVYNPNINSYQNVSNPQATYARAGFAGSTNTTPGGQSPAAVRLTPQTGNQSYPQGSNYLIPASRQSTSPTPVQPQNNSTQPVCASPPRRTTGSSTTISSRYPIQRQNRRVHEKHCFL